MALVVLGAWAVIGGTVVVGRKVNKHIKKKRAKREARRAVEQHVAITGRRYEPPVALELQDEEELEESLPSYDDSLESSESYSPDSAIPSYDQFQQQQLSQLHRTITATSLPSYEEALPGLLEVKVAPAH